MIEKIVEKIKKADTVIIHRHTNPDGDAIGSQVGLKYIIKENFPDKRVLAVGDAAGRYSFVEGSTTDDVQDSDYEGALAIILDTSASALISDGRYTLAQDTARIDHHIFCEKIADAELVDTSYESCCGLVTEFALSAGLKIPPISAAALYTGMVTDSGRFRYDSTTDKTFRLASALMSVGVDIASIYKNLYTDDFERVKLRAQFVLKVKFTEKGVAYIYTTREELESYNADLFFISRGMVSTMSDLRGVDIWANFTESEGGVLCEIRSSKYNINPVAKKYGGGGHAKASGATLKDYGEAMALLADLEALLED
ncbi:MAG: bifunctional oligoribonuclease/PAP phosphatase NrnA [Clostridia bacterium]|nr:bifunctional oligoribonuclease/PAP phosphatase NrnA [Clostridia bacterium]